MNDISDTAPTSTSTAFADLITLARLFADPKALQAQMDAFTARDTKSRDLEASAKRAVTALSNREAELEARVAELDEREREIAATEGRWQQRNAALDAREAAVSEEGQLAEMRKIRRKVEGQENWLRAQLMLISGLNTRYQGVLQELPCFADVVAEIMRDNQSKQPEPVYEHDPADAPVSMPVDALVTGTTLTRSERTGRRGADRRVES